MVAHGNNKPIRLVVTLVERLLQEEISTQIIEDVKSCLECRHYRPRNISPYFKCRYIPSLVWQCTGYWWYCWTSLVPPGDSSCETVDCYTRDGITSCYNTLARIFMFSPKRLLFLAWPPSVRSWPKRHALLCCFAFHGQPLISQMFFPVNLSR